MRKSGPSVKIVTRTDPGLAMHIASKTSARTHADLMRFSHPDRHFFLQRIDGLGYRVAVSRPFPARPTALSRATDASTVSPWTSAVPASPTVR